MTDDTDNLITEEEAHRVQGAATRGFDLDKMIRGLHATMSDGSKPVDKTFELLARWKVAAASLTPEEIAEEDRGWYKIEYNLLNNRLALQHVDVHEHD